MTKKPKLAILGGTGKFGQALAIRFGRMGYPLIIGTRQKAKGLAVVNKLQDHFQKESVEIEDYSAAAHSADIIIIAVPYEAQDSAIEQIRQGAEGKIVISTIVPLQIKNRELLELPMHGSAALLMQRQLGKEVKVVAAFQNIAAHLLNKPELKLDCDVLVCSDHLEACRTVTAMAFEIGLRGIYAGPLANSAAIESMTSLLIAINKFYKIEGAGIKITQLENLERPCQASSC